jgi:hypothetical protein
LRFHALERGRFHDTQTHGETDYHEYEAEEERQTPANGQESRIPVAARGVRCAHLVEKNARKNEAKRHSHLRTAGKESFEARLRVLRRHHDGAAPFSANGDALAQPQRDEQHRRPNANPIIAWQQAD